MDSFNPLTTLAISAGSLALGIPVAVVAVTFEKVYMPNIILGSKEIKAGIDETKTINFSLLSGSNDAVISGAFISIISVLLFAGGLTIMRHVSKHNIWGWAMFGPALLNLLAQIGVLAYVQISQGQHPEATSTDEIKYVNGSYNTNGKLYTREGWACSMEKLYHEREGEWATKACSNLVRVDVSFYDYKKCVRLTDMYRKLAE
jgi:hypothetical protein